MNSDHEPNWKDDVVSLEQGEEEESTDKSHYESKYYNFEEGTGDVGTPKKKQLDVADTGDHGIGGSNGGADIDNSNIQEK